MNIKQWLLSKEPQIQHGLAVGLQLTEKLLKFDKSAGGQALTQLIVTEIPKSQPWTSEVIKIAEDLAVDLVAVSNPASQKAICLRIIGEVIALVDGKKLPTGIDGYLAIAQSIFTGE